MNELIISPDLRQEMLNCNQDKTRFQVKHFVIGKHTCPVMRYRQVMLELRTCTSEIVRMETEMEEVKLEMKKAAQKLERLDYELDARRKEYSKYTAEKAQMKTYSVEEIEEADQKSQTERLAQEAITFKVADVTKIPFGWLQTMEQAKMIALRSESVDGQEKIFLDRLTQPQLNGHG